MQSVKKTKILVLGFLPPPQEGTSKITEMIIRSEYLRNKYDLLFLSLSKRQRAIKRGKFSLINVFLAINNYIKFLYFIVKYNPEIVHLPLAQNKFGFLRDSIFIIIGKMFGKKICLHFLGGSFDMFLAGSSKAYQKYIKFVLRKVDRTVVLAEKLKYQFAELVPENSISVLYNPSPLNNDILKNSPIENKNNNSANILFIGCISKAKGALDLVKAIKSVKIKFKGNISVNLCGQQVNVESNIKFIDNPDGAYSRILEIIKEDGLNSEVKLPGQVDDERKDILFRNTDIFVFPSYSEGCPIAVMEAMSYGLPLIVTPVGALPEMLKENENCLFVNSGDDKAIAEKILFLINSPDRRKEMGKNNYELIRTKYNPEIFSRQLSEVWGSIPR